MHCICIMMWPLAVLIFKFRQYAGEISTAGPGFGGFQVVDSGFHFTTMPKRVMMMRMTSESVDAAQGFQVEVQVASTVSDWQRALPRAAAATWAACAIAVRKIFSIVPLWPLFSIWSIPGGQIFVK